MSLILIQTIVQAVSSTLTWLGFYVGIRASPDARARKSRWIIGSAVVAAAWLVGVFLLGAANVFRNDVLPPRVPMALFATLLLGYLLLLSPTFRRFVAAVPQHWLIGIQAFRVLGGVCLVRYYVGELPGLFALPAGIGDVATGLLALFVAYAWYSGKPYARGAAIAWNLFGMADLVDAVVLGTLHRRRAWHRLPDRAHPGLCRAARVPHPFLFTNRPPAQNLATAAAHRRQL